MRGAEGISPPVAPVIAPGPTDGAKVAAPADAKGREAAREFEATLLAMLLKDMRSTLEPDGLFPGDSGDVQGGLFDLFLSRHLADAGGVGLATALVNQIRPPAPTNTPDAQPTRGPLPGQPGR